MENFLQQIVSGIASGSLFAILALAIVLTHRSTGTPNFAQGQMAMFTTFITWAIMSTWVGFWAAVVMTLLAALALGALIEGLVVRRVEGMSPLNSLILTLGLFILFNGLALYIWGPLPRGFGPFSVFSGSASCLGGVCIGRLSVGIFVVASLIMLVLLAVFQRTKFGLAMRAVSENRLASRLMGIPVARMLGAGWALSAMVGAVAGILVAQSLGLDNGFMFSIFLFAISAAILGGLDSPVGAVVGGLTIGIVRNLAGTYVPSSVGGVDVTAAFLIIVLVLMVRPNGIFGHAEQRRV